MTVSKDTPLSLVHVLSNRIDRAFYGEIETQFGVTLTEWRILLSLRSEPGLSAAEITNRWAMEKMSVNRAVQRLEEQGAIKRRRDPADARRFQLTLTTKGQKQHAKVWPTASKRYAELTDTITKNEKDILVSTLQKIIRRADQLR